MALKGRSQSLKGLGLKGKTRVRRNAKGERREALTSNACSSKARVDGEPLGSSKTHCTLRGVLWPERRVPPGGRLSPDAVPSGTFMTGGESMADSFEVDGVGERRMLAIEGT